MHIKRGRVRVHSEYSRSGVERPSSPQARAQYEGGSKEMPLDAIGAAPRGSVSKSAHDKNNERYYDNCSQQSIT